MCDSCNAEAVVYSKLAGPERAARECYASRVDLFALTRKLIDVESVTGNEGAVGELLAQELSSLGYGVRKIPVEGPRMNVFALPPGVTHPEIVLSTHMDVVPPFFASSEDGEKIYGRGACDAKGIIAAQIAAAERLRAEGTAVGLLFLVGEERDSLGAKVANRLARELHGGRCKFLINGEPTENRVALASKGTLRVQLTASGKMAHSAYPELGDSAIEKLVHALERLLMMPLPSHPDFGPCTVNIGLIEGGRATNVIPDHARAQMLYRLIGSSDELRKKIVECVGDLAKAEFILEIPFTKLRTLDGLPTMIAAFTTDIPALPDWGEPVLLGPGSIHVAHTEREFVGKKDLMRGVDLYCEVARGLLK
jgi:acetylornithine deacetylase